LLGSTLIEIDEVSPWLAFYFVSVKIILLEVGLGHMEFVHRIEGMITPSIEAMGFRLVSINYTDGKNPRLQIMAEHAETGRMNVEDCENVSRTISAVLDVEDPLVGAYALEISSPGIDRPLVSLEDFEKFLGFDAKIEISRAIGGRKRIKGRLQTVKGEIVTIEAKNKVFNLAYQDIEKAKLLLSDELIAASEGLPK
jgi:ribosome maturation factor RimP